MNWLIVYDLYYLLFHFNLSGHSINREDLICNWSARQCEFSRLNMKILFNSKIVIDIVLNYLPNIFLEHVNLPKQINETFSPA